MSRLHAGLLSRPSTLLLALTCLALGTLAWHRIGHPVSPLPPGPAVTDSVQGIEAFEVRDPVQPAALQAYAEITERPLFDPNRRPPETDAPAAEAARSAAPPRDPPQARLTGVVLVAGSRFALLDELSRGVRLRVREGDQIDGWTVADVSRNRVTLSLGDTSVDLGLARNDPEALPPSPDGQAVARGAARGGAAVVASRLATTTPHDAIDRIAEALDLLPSLGLDPREEQRHRAELENMLKRELQRSERWEEDDW